MDDLVHSEEGIVFDALGDVNADCGGGERVRLDHRPHGMRGNGEHDGLDLGVGLAGYLNLAGKEDSGEEIRTAPLLAEHVRSVLLARPEAHMVAVDGEEARQGQPPTSRAHYLKIHDGHPACAARPIR